MEQQIRFCRADDGVELAYAAHGRGPVVVKVANWLTHLEHDWRSPVWRHWLEELGRGHRLVRYDQRGCGLSDRRPERLTLDAFVGDLAAVVDAAGLERFALLGISQGGAVGVAYAARHPERVSHLVLCGAYARGRARRETTAEQRAEDELLESVIRGGWGRPHPAFRRVFTARFLPGATPEEMAWFDELQRVSTTPETAVRLRAAWGQIDVTDRLAAVAAPALVAHARDDAVVPFAEGRRLAAGIPYARLLPLQSRNHILLADEPAWPVFRDAVRDVLGVGVPAGSGREPLSPRELDVLRMVAAGLDNAQIAQRLHLSVRTVERHLSNVYGKLGVSGKAARAAAAAHLAHRE